MRAKTPKTAKQKQPAGEVAAAVTTAPETVQTAVSAGDEPDARLARQEAQCDTDHIATTGENEACQPSEPEAATDDLEQLTLTDGSRSRVLSGWKQRFVQQLEKSGSVIDAARAGNVSRETAYAHRHSDAEFAAAWADALEGVTDRIEARAVEMSTDGLEHAVWHKGEIVGYEREVDAGTVQFMLRSRRRSVYGDKVELQHTGAVAHLVVTPADVVRRVVERAPLLADRLAQLKRIKDRSQSSQG